MECYITLGFRCGGVSYGELRGYRTGRETLYKVSYNVRYNVSGTEIPCPFMEGILKVTLYTGKTAGSSIPLL
jgi:hypothetical protein